MNSPRMGPDLLLVIIIDNVINIIINNIMNDSITNISNKNNSSKEEVVRIMQKSIPLGRFAEPNEIAHLVVFLCSEYASYITGINVPVDGGRTRSL